MRSALRLSPIGLISVSLLVVFAPLAGKVASAQTRGDGFLFQPPTGSVTFHVGMARANDGSEIFAFTRELLTLEKGDFNSISLGFEYAHRLDDRFDVFGSVGYAGASERSEFRDWVDENELPIEQTTRFTRVPLSVGGRMYLLPRGHAVGRFAWIPATVSPHIAAGVGMIWYRFQQNGDFVVDDAEIVSDKLSSSGWSPYVHAGGGLDITLSPRLLLASEVRYGWGRAEMQEDFSGFEEIDLSGITASVGLKIRF
jgi:hypothetical protein